MVNLYYDLIVLLPEDFDSLNWIDVDNSIRLPSPCPGLGSAKVTIAFNYHPDLLLHLICEPEAGHTDIFDELLDTMAGSPNIGKVWFIDADIQRRDNVPCSSQVPYPYRQTYHASDYRLVEVRWEDEDLWLHPQDSPGDSGSLDLAQMLDHTLWQLCGAPDAYESHFGVLGCEYR